MSTLRDAVCRELPGDADVTVCQLYSLHAQALHSYVVRFCPDPASADDIVQETSIRGWRHLLQLTADDRPVRPWLFRVARNLLIDADRAAQSRPVTVPEQFAGDGPPDTSLPQVHDRELGSGALQHLSPAHWTALVETFYYGRTLTTVARLLGIPRGTAQSPRKAHGRGP